MALDIGGGGQSPFEYMDEWEKTRWQQELKRKEQQKVQRARPATSRVGIGATVGFETQPQRPTLNAHDSWTEFIASIHNVGGVDAFNTNVARTSKTWRATLGSLPNPALVVDLSRFSASPSNSIKAQETLNNAWHAYRGTMAPENSVKTDWFMARGQALPNGTDPVARMVQNEWDMIRGDARAWGQGDEILKRIGAGITDSKTMGAKIAGLFNPMLDFPEDINMVVSNREILEGRSYVPTIYDISRSASLWSMATAYPTVVLFPDLEKLAAYDPKKDSELVIRQAEAKGDFLDAMTDKAWSAFRTNYNLSMSSLGILGTAVVLGGICVTRDMFLAEEEATGSWAKAAYSVFNTMVKKGMQTMFAPLAEIPGISETLQILWQLEASVSLAIYANVKNGIYSMTHRPSLLALDPFVDTKPGLIVDPQLVSKGYLTEAGDVDWSGVWQRAAAGSDLITEAMTDLGLDPEEHFALTASLQMVLYSSVEAGTGGAVKSALKTNTAKAATGYILKNVAHVQDATDWMAKETSVGKLADFTGSTDRETLLKLSKANTREEVTQILADSFTESGFYIDGGEFMLGRRLQMKIIETAMSANPTGLQGMIRSGFLKVPGRVIRLDDAHIIRDTLDTAGALGLDSKTAYSYLDRLLAVDKIDRPAILREMEARAMGGDVMESLSKVNLSDGTVLEVAKEHVHGLILGDITPEAVAKTMAPLSKQKAVAAEIENHLQSTLNGMKMKGLQDMWRKHRAQSGYDRGSVLFAPDPYPDAVGVTGARELSVTSKARIRDALQAEIAETERLVDWHKGQLTLPLEQTKRTTMVPQEAELMRLGFTPEEIATMRSDPASVRKIVRSIAEDNERWSKLNTPAARNFQVEIGKIGDEVDIWPEGASRSEMWRLFAESRDSIEARAYRWKATEPAKGSKHVPLQEKEVLASVSGAKSGDTILINSVAGSSDALGEALRRFMQEAASGPEGGYRVKVAVSDPAQAAALKELGIPTTRAMSKSQVARWVSAQELISKERYVREQLAAWKEIDFTDMSPDEIWQYYMELNDSERSLAANANLRNLTAEAIEKATGGKITAEQVANLDRLSIYERLVESRLPKVRDIRQRAEVLASQPQNAWAKSFIERMREAETKPVKDAIPLIGPFELDAATVGGKNLRNWWARVTGIKAISKAKRLEDLAPAEQAALQNLKPKTLAEFAKEMGASETDIAKVLSEELGPNAARTKANIMGGAVKGAETKLGYFDRLAQENLIADLHSQVASVDVMVNELRRTLDDLEASGLKVQRARTLVDRLVEYRERADPYGLNESKLRTAEAGDESLRSIRTAEGKPYSPGVGEAESRLAELRRALEKLENSQDYAAVPLYPYQSMQEYALHMPPGLVMASRSEPLSVLERMNIHGWGPNDAGWLDQATSVWKRIVLANPGIQTRILGDEPLRAIVEGYGVDAALSATKAAPAVKWMEEYLSTAERRGRSREMIQERWNEGSLVDIDWLGRDFTSSNYTTYIPKGGPGGVTTPGYVTQFMHVMPSIARQPHTRAWFEGGMTKEAIFKWATETEQGRRFMQTERGATKATLVAKADEFAASAHEHLYKLTHAPSDSPMHPLGCITPEEQAAYQSFLAKGGDKLLRQYEEVPIEWPEYKYVKASPADAPNTTWYHGQSERLSGGKYGPGLYLSEDPVHAGGKGTLHMVDLSEIKPERVLEADVPLTDPRAISTISRAVNTLDPQVAKQVLDEWKKAKAEDVTLSSIYDSVRKAVGDTPKAEEILVDFNNALAKEYDVILRHDGGRNGLVVLDPHGMTTGKSKVATTQVVTTAKRSVAAKALEGLENPIILREGEEIAFGKVWKSNPFMEKVLRTGNVSRKEVERQPVEMLPVFAARAPRMKSSPGFVDTVLKPADKILDVSAGLGKNIRSTIYAREFQRRFVDILQQVDKLYREGKTTKLPLVDMSRIDNLCHEYAIRQVERMTYNGSKTGFEYAMRNTIPFLPATRDFMVYWGKYLLSKPYLIPTYLRLTQLPEKIELEVPDMIATAIGTIIGGMVEYVAGEDAGLDVKNGIIKGLGDAVISFNPAQTTFLLGGSRSSSERDDWLSLIEQQFPGLGPWVTYPARWAAAAVPDIIPFLKEIPGLDMVDVDLPINSRFAKLAYGVTGLVSAVFSPETIANFIRTGHLEMGEAHPVNLPGPLGRNPETLKQLMDKYIQFVAMTDKNVPWGNPDEAAAYLKKQASKMVANDKFIEGLVSFFAPASIRAENQMKMEAEQATRQYVSTFHDWTYVTTEELAFKLATVERTKQKKIRDTYPEYSVFFDYVDALHSGDGSKVEEVVSRNPGVVAFFQSIYDKTIGKAEAAEMKRAGIKENTPEEWLWISEHKLASAMPPERYAAAIAAKVWDIQAYDNWRKLEAEFQAEVDKLGLEKQSQEYKDLRAKYDAIIQRANDNYQRENGRDYYKQTPYYQLITTPWEQHQKEVEAAALMKQRQMIWADYDNAVASSNLTQREKDRIALARDQELKRLGLPLGRPTEPPTMLELRIEDLVSYCSKDWHVMLEDDLTRRGIKVSDKTMACIDQAFRYSQEIYKAAGNNLATVYSNKFAPQRQAYFEYVRTLAATDEGFAKAWQWHMMQNWERLRYTNHPDIKVSTKTAEVWEQWFTLLDMRDDALLAGRIRDKNGNPVTSFSMTDPSQAAKPWYDKLMEALDAYKAYDQEFAEQFDMFPMSFWSYVRKW